MRGRWLRRLGALFVVPLLLVSCSVEAVSEATTTAAPRVERSTGPVTSPAHSNALAAPTETTTAPTGSRYFLIDKLVRSSQLEGIDLHVRYLERTVDGVTIHLSFYNNRGEDLAYVSGADVGSAELVGDDTYNESEHSQSLDSGIDPEGGWLNGGATVGSITFAGAQGDDFTFSFPGFPDVPLTLDQPITALPDAPAPATGAYTYDLEVTSSRLENIALRVESARVEQDALLLTIGFVNRNEGDITFTSTVSGNDAVLFDGMWRQYRPGTVEQSIDAGIEPEGSVWGEDEVNQGTLTFPRPLNGDVVLFQFPSYPLVRIPLTSGAEATVATEADLPPSAAPRPTPTPSPTPTPLTGEDLARQEINDVFVQLSEALVGRNRETYLAAFAPELQAAQGEIFDRLGNLPVEELKLEPVEDESSGSFNSDATEITGYAVDLTYRVRDVDPANIFTSNGEYSLRQQDGRWLITEVGGRLPFWAYGPTEATRSGAFWIFYRPEMAGELGAVEQEAQQAFDVVNQVLPGRAAPVNVMYITASEEEFADLTERSGSRFLGVAAARYQIKKAGIQITSQAFYINGAAFESDPQQDRRQTIAHELTHLVLSPKTMPYTPAWISEGAAMFVSNDYPKDVLAEWYRNNGAESMSLADLSSKTSFGEHDFTGEQTSIDYAYSAYLARYLVETYGQDQFFALYDSFADVPFDVISDELPSFGGGFVFNAAFGNLAQKLAPESVQDVLGVDLATLEREYETWLAQQLQ